ncbi:MAG: helix-turn-helix transcriptional regulator [Actinobacteria bacterium]|nr:helix-turn-helix transcriptional regulator [Actinomycetota bacterium]
MLSADLLREARLRTGLTQAELGRRVGKPASMISRWERGKVEPSLETLRTLVRACGLDLWLRFANFDDSYVEFIDGYLALTPAERVRGATERVNTLRRLIPAIEAGRRG